MHCGLVIICSSAWEFPERNPIAIACKTENSRSLDNKTMTQLLRPRRPHRKFSAICALLLALAVSLASAQQRSALVDGVDAIGITVSDRRIRTANAGGAHEARRRVHRTH